MKNLVLVNAFFLILLYGCKKDDPLATDKKDISGTWYYQVYNVQYFDSNVELMYYNNAPVQTIRGLPSFTFNSDFSGSYGDTPFTYQFKFGPKNAGADSLLASGSSFTHRFRLVSISKDQVVLEENIKDAEELVNTLGEIKYSTYRQWNITLGRTKMTP